VSYRLACRIRAIHGIAADMVVGSMSVHCAYYAGDLPLEGIERLGTIWRRLRRSLAGEIVAPISVSTVSTVTPSSMPLRDFVPWRFLDAGRNTAWIVSASRRAKTCTRADHDQPGRPRRAVRRVVGEHHASLLAIRQGASPLAVQLPQLGVE
jgi:hypothetical protein